MNERDTKTRLNHRCRKRIALILITQTELDGGGGAERLFSSIIDLYQNKDEKKYQIYFITNLMGYRILKSIGRFKSDDNIIKLKYIPNKIVRTVILQVQLFKAVFMHKFDLVHICIPGIIYVPFLLMLNIIPSRVRPKITMNIVDCSIAEIYSNPNMEDFTGQFSVHHILLRLIKFDGIFTWYELFKKNAENKIIKTRGKPIITAAQYCFTDTNHFYPYKNKNNIIVFAGRLDTQKRPLFFLEAIKICYEMEPDIFKEWSVLILGKGQAEHEIKNKIHHFNLDGFVKINHKGDLSSIFGKSKIFVSTQDYENFTSLSMLEAMAAGNVIVARDVGQTHYFVKHERNGFIIERDNASALSSCLIKIMKDTKLQQTMGSESRKITTTLHTWDNFISDLEKFWDSVLRA